MTTETPAGGVDLEEALGMTSAGNGIIRKSYEAAA
jgi:hypothetical protein